MYPGRISKDFCCASEVCQTSKEYKYIQNPEIHHLINKITISLRVCSSLVEQISLTGEMLYDLRSVKPNNTTNQVLAGIFTSGLDVLAALVV